MKSLISLFAICIPLFFWGQNIQVLSIKADRQASGDVGYTLDGSQMADARSKLLNPANFGPTGTYTKTVLITDSFDTSGSLTGISSMPTDNIFFFGAFDIGNVAEIFVQDEVDALYDWSTRGGKMIICAGQTSSLTGYDSRILNSKWGFTFFETSGIGSSTPQGNSSGLFNGVFGAVSSVAEGNPVKGYLDTIPQNSLVYGGPPGQPTVIMDCNTLDLIVANAGMFTNSGGISSGITIQNKQDRFWANAFAFMDKLQPLPVVTKVNDTLRVDSVYLSYQWYKDDQPIAGATKKYYPVTEFGTYYVKAMVNGGCLARSNDLIKPDTTVIVDTECDIFVPTAFSPDGNGINETLCAYGKCFEDIEFKIFDRWGELVFETKNRWTCWDGTYKGSKANSGVYVWSFKATRPSGSKVSQKGNITLIR